MSKVCRLRENEGIFFGSGPAHPLEEELARIAEVPQEKRTKGQKARATKLAGATLGAISAARDRFVEVLNDFVAMERCRPKFSLCLDCGLHGKCEKYLRHREAAEAGKAKKPGKAMRGWGVLEDVAMTCPERLVGKFVVLWRNENLPQAAKVTRVRPEVQRLDYEILRGEGGGKKFSSRFYASQTVAAFASEKSALKAEENWEEFARERNKRFEEAKG